MTKNWLCFALLGAMGVLIGCARPDTLLLSDPFWQIFSFPNASTPELETLFRDRGFSLGVEIIPETLDIDSIETIIKKTKTKSIIVSPLLWGRVAALATQFPNRRFITLSFSPSESGQAANIQVIHTSRQNAFKRAGELCSRFVQETESSSRTVVALFYSGTNERVKEREAFMEGFGRLSSALITESFSRIETDREIKSYLRGLKQKEDPLFFVALSGQNKETIAAIAAQFSSYIITEGISRSGAFTDRIVASIEEMWEDAVVKLLRNRNAEPIMEAVLSPGSSSGILRLPWITGFF